MTLWVAILLVGLGSYAFRVVPFLLGRSVQMSERTSDALRHAAVGAMTAMLATGVADLSRDLTPLSVLAAVLAVGVSIVVAFAGRSMPVVVVSGAATYGVSTLVVTAILA
jgi:branched-subunit amino acid transport protein